MKIAFLVQSHKCVEQINILSEILSSEGDDVYIHFDRKSKENRNDIHIKDNVFLLPIEKTENVGWGKYSQCVCMLRLVEEVLESGREYDYIWLLSGQDFPVKDIKSIKSSLGTESLPYIDIISKENADRLCFDKRNEIAYPDWIIGKKLYQKILKKLLIIITGGKKKTFGIFKKKCPAENLYYGSQWWCLPYDCVKEILSILKNDNRYTEYFSTSLCPDESFVQTLFMQTGYAGKQQGNLTYIDWNEGQSSPKTFTEKDFAEITEFPDKYLFVRKVDLASAPRLVELLKQKIGVE